MISLIFPFFNEEKRIHLFTEGLNSYKNPHQLIREIILVDDGSTDGTAQKLKEVQVQHPEYRIKIIQVTPNKGKGNAIREGVMAAEQPWILCNDADLSYSMQQIDEWVDNYPVDFNKINTVYFGSRELGKKNHAMKLFLHRKIIGRIYAFLIRRITGVLVLDTQCGYKLYPSGIAKKIFSKTEEMRFAFDVEVHYLLQKEKVEVVLLPVYCVDVGGSKVNLIKDSWQMFEALFRIRRRHS